MSKIYFANPIYALKIKKDFDNIIFIGANGFPHSERRGVNFHSLKMMLPSTKLIHEYYSKNMDSTRFCKKYSIELIRDRDKVNELESLVYSAQILKEKNLVVISSVETELVKQTIINQLKNISRNIGINDYGQRV